MNNYEFKSNIIKNMKSISNRILLFALVATVFTSCVKERISFKNPTDDDRSVVFTFGGKGTRAAPGHPVENDPVFQDRKSVV